MEQRKEEEYDQIVAFLDKVKEYIEDDKLQTSANYMSLYTEAHEISRYLDVVPPDMWLAFLYGRAIGKSDKERNTLYGLLKPWFRQYAITHKGYLITKEEFMEKTKN